MYRSFCFSFLVLIITSCSRQQGKESSGNTAAPKEFPAIGTIEVLDAALEEILDPNVKIEIIADSFVWAEGPLWLSEQGMLLFSDVPTNKIYQWSETSGLALYLTPSGYTGTIPRGGETGSNGLLLDGEGKLVLCQHGDRRIARMIAPLNNPKPAYVTLTDNYKGMRFNSPNDAVYKNNDDLYFTDPPYGLENKIKDPHKEIPFQGVYRLSKDGKVHLLTKALSRPNGIAFSPDEKTLYVANSDPKRPVWMAFDVMENGNLANGRVFFDATALAKKEKGLPDGLKVAEDGTLFASGPGGILIINKEGKHLGTIKTVQAASNCAFNEDESVLYITADMYVMRVRM